MHEKPHDGAMIKDVFLEDSVVVEPLNIYTTFASAKH